MISAAYVAGNQVPLLREAIGDERGIKCRISRITSPRALRTLSSLCVVEVRQGINDLRE